MQKAKLENTSSSTSVSLDEYKETMETVVASLQEENKIIKQQLEYALDKIRIANKSLFGKSKETYISPGPYTLGSDFAKKKLLQPKYIDAPSSSNEEPISKKKPHLKSPNKKIPRVPEEFTPTDFPEGAKCTGEEITERIKYGRGYFLVRKIIRKKYTVKDEEGSNKLFTPFYNYIRDLVLASDCIQADETTLPVLTKDKPGYACPKSTEYNRN